MSQQIEFLKNLIESARTGNDAAVTLLRQICVSAAGAAPVYDLIALGQCLVSLGNEATRTQAGQN